MPDSTEATSNSNESNQPTETEGGSEQTIPDSDLDYKLDTATNLVAHWEQGPIPRYHLYNVSWTLKQYTSPALKNAGTEVFDATSKGSIEDITSALTKLGQALESGQRKGGIEVIEAAKAITEIYRFRPVDESK